MSGNSRSGRRKVGEWALRLLGVALLVFVIQNVGWQDSVRLAHAPGQSAEVVRGWIVGEPPATIEDWEAGGTITLELGDGNTRTFAQADLDTVEIGDVPIPVVDPGLKRIVTHSDWGWLLAGWLLFLFTAHFGVLRWWMLLRAQGIHVGFWVVHKLTFVGMFFNNVMPGATGGDVIKAIYIAQHTEKRAAAVVTVLIDRLTGMLALTLIAAAVLVFNLDNPRYAELAAVVGLILAAGVVAALVFFSRRVRRVLRVEELSARLPGGRLIRQVDQAILMYRDQKRVVFWAIVLSFANQLSIMVIMLLFAEGLGVTTRAGTPVPVGDYLVAMPVAFIVSAIPLLPGGWGVREAAFAVCFALVGVARSASVPLSVLSGVNQLLWSLLGGVYLALGRGRDRAMEVATHASASDMADDGEPEPPPGSPPGS